MRSFKPLLLALGVAACASPSAQAAAVVYDFSGSCFAFCTGTQTGYLSLADGYVAGAAITAADFVDITFTGPASGAYTNAFMNVIPTGVLFGGNGLFLDLIEDDRGQSSRIHINVTVGPNSTFTSRFNNGTPYFGVSNLNWTLRAPRLWRQACRLPRPSASLDSALPAWRLCAGAKSSCAASGGHATRRITPHFRGSVEMNGARPASRHAHAQRNRGLSPRWRRKHRVVHRPVDHAAVPEHGVGFDAVFVQRDLARLQPVGLAQPHMRRARSCPTPALKSVRLHSVVASHGQVSNKPKHAPPVESGARPVAAKAVGHWRSFHRLARPRR